MADIIDKVKQGFDKGVAVVSVKSKELIDITRLRNQIGALEDQIRKTYPEIGETVCRMACQDGLDVALIKEKCKLVADLKVQIKEKEEELRLIRQKAQEALGKTFCASCDAELSENAKFCSFCGQKVEEKPVTADNQPVIDGTEPQSGE